ncbi:MAG: hypothetical protein JXA89_24750 [Anaerolineae bacterium]|nr:hypothetical protein [Anaerolineae bacterium]
MDDLYPLRFAEILRNYGFGDRWIVDAFDKEGLPQNHRIAETWEVCDRPGESSVVVNGSLSGKTLHALIDVYGAQLLGADVVGKCGTRFPLLIKFLDASNPLGEQIHQNDELAAKQGLTDPGKTEAWYMLKVRDGATIRCGNDDGVTEQRVREALLDGTIRETMREYVVQPGDAFLLYAGTMHYSAGGVLFYEIMQNSDVIIGLRPPAGDLTAAEKEAKVELALEGIHLENGFECKIVPLIVQQGTNKRSFVFACTYFVLERLDLLDPYRLDCDGDRFYVLSQIEGSSVIECGAYRVPMRAGYTCMLPACLGEVTIIPDGRCALLKSYLPDLMHNVVAPLREAGFADEDIVALGGKTALNPLRRFLAQA